MTSVTVTTAENTVEVQDGTPPIVTVQKGDATTVELTTVGPQGASFASSTKTMIDTNRVNKSIIYYDSAAGTYKADSTYTTSTLTDGGNF